MSTTPLRYANGPAIAAARRAARLTQVELAELVGTSQVVISYIESGRRDASLRLLSKLADALEAPRGPFLRSEAEAIDVAAGTTRAVA